jgi:GDP-L-fucose synthase
MEIWGSGSPKREFLHVDDLAEACYFLMLNYNEPQFLNIGTGEDISIYELTELVKEIVGFEGEIRTNTEMPDGTPRKLMDVSKINALGWKASIPLREGITAVFSEINSREWA